MCTAGVRCGRCDLGVTSVLLDSELLPCESSGCHTGRVSQVYGIFSYTRGTLAVCCRVLPCVTVWSGVSYAYVTIQHKSAGGR